MGYAVAFQYTRQAASVSASRQWSHVPLGLTGLKEKGHWENQGICTVYNVQDDPIGFHCRKQ